MHLILLLCVLAAGASSRPILTTSEKEASLPQQDSNVKTIQLFGVKIHAPNSNASASTNSAGLRPNEVIPASPSHRLKQVQGKTNEESKSDTKSLNINNEIQQPSSSSDRKAFIKKYFFGDSYQLKDLDPKYRIDPEKEYTPMQKGALATRRNKLKVKLLGRGNKSRDKLEDILLQFGAEVGEVAPKTAIQQRYISLRDRKREAGLRLHQRLPKQYQKKKGRHFKEHKEHVQTH